MNIPKIWDCLASPDWWIAAAVPIVIIGLPVTLALRLTDQVWASRSRKRKQIWESDVERLVSSGSVQILTDALEALRHTNNSRWLLLIVGIVAAIMWYCTRSFAYPWSLLCALVGILGSVCLFFLSNRHLFRAVWLGSCTKEAQVRVSKMVPEGEEPDRQTLTQVTDVADIKNRIQKWADHRPLSAVAHEYSSIDERLAIPPGSARQYLPSIATELGWEVDRPGAETITFKSLPHPVASWVDEIQSRSRYKRPMF